MDIPTFWKVRFKVMNFLGEAKYEAKTIQNTPIDRQLQSFDACKEVGNYPMTAHES